MLDVLILDWTTLITRDRMVSSQVYSYLDSVGIKVKEGPLQDGLYLINKYKPKVLLFVNTVGSVTSVELAKYAKLKGVIVISLYGEGNFSYDRIEQFIWGHNKVDKYIIDDFRLVWNKQALEYICEYSPELADTTYISGSVGADNYVMGNVNSENLKLKHSEINDFEMIVGVGCWNFCILEQRDHRYKTFLELVGEIEVQRLRDDCELFNKELFEIIKQCPDVLFLIKEHPHKSNFGNSSGVVGLEVFPNVVFVDKNESIISCIEASDIWLTYESTTAMEAWLLGKKTALLNPTGVKFNSDWRAEIYKGQPNYLNSHEWVEAINYYKENSSLPNYEDLNKERDKILLNSFGNIDGLNHVRTSKFIIDVLNGDIDVLDIDIKYSSKYNEIDSLIKHCIFMFNKIPLVRKLLNIKATRRFLTRGWDEKDLIINTNKVKMIQHNFYSSMECSEFNVSYQGRDGYEKN